MSHAPFPRLDVGPLLEALPPLEIREFGESHSFGRKNMNRRANKALSRARLAGSITVYTADRLAVEILHKHPAEIWGDEWRLAWREVF